MRRLTDTLALVAAPLLWCSFALLGRLLVLGERAAAYTRSNDTDRETEGDSDSGSLRESRGVQARARFLHAAGS